MIGCRHKRIFQLCYNNNNEQLVLALFSRSPCLVLRLVTSQEEEIKEKGKGKTRRARRIRGNFCLVSLPLCRPVNVQFFHCLLSCIQFLAVSVKLLRGKLTNVLCFTCSDQKTSTSQIQRAKKFRLQSVLMVFVPNQTTGIPGERA